MVRQLGILHVAHGGELLIKSAIAQTHPLAIFTKPPKYARSGNSHLSFADLVRSARTVGYQDLPALLEEKTGYKLPDQEMYREVGTLRNVVQHFTVPNAEYARLVLTFLCKVADPLLARFWSVEIFREIYQYWGEDDYYLFRDEPWFAEALERHGIQYSGWLPTPETVG